MKFFFFKPHQRVKFFFFKKNFHAPPWISNGAPLILGIYNILHVKVQEAVAGKLRELGTVHKHLLGGLIKKWGALKIFDHCKGGA